MIRSIRWLMRWLVPADRRRDLVVDDRSHEQMERIRKLSHRVDQLSQDPYLRQVRDVLRGGPDTDDG